MIDLKLLLCLCFSNFLLLYSTTGKTVDFIRNNLIVILTCFWWLEACGINEWRCETGGRCIPASWRCNRIVDCTDSSDERNCSELSLYHLIRIFLYVRIFFFKLILVVRMLNSIVVIVVFLVHGDAMEIMIVPMELMNKIAVRLSHWWNELFDMVNILLILL